MTVTDKLNGNSQNGTTHVSNGNTNGQQNGLANSQPIMSLDAGLEPIAICGIGLRLPGAIRTGDDFWDVLYHGKDLRGPIPADRFNISAFDDLLGKKGAINTRHGYFLDEDLGLIDASFFNMSKAELEKTDPQQRKLLEVARECLENAGEVNWRGKSVGVYVGTFGDDWLQSTTKESQVTGSYNFSGDLMLANRVSYEFDFQGPSLVVKTGCSASLVALHEACRALQRQDCTAALVCGTSLLMGPHIFTVMTNEGVLSPEGSSKTFDAKADGFARADGINAVFLKRLPDALRDGNPIRAIVRNSGNNSDGKSQGLLSPRSSTQEALIRHVYSQAKLDPSETGFIECHGTGTATGDPIETSAVGNVFGEKGIYIGSVKPNTGHSEGASGLTSLIKAVLALEHKIIPPNIKFSVPNPKIAFEKNKLVVPVKPTPWPSNRTERISINSFGIGGSNAHVIVDSIEQFLTDNPTLTHRWSLTFDKPTWTLPRLLLFSANNAESTKGFARQSIKYATQRPESLVDLAYSLSSRREKLPHRSYALVSANGVIAESAPVVKTTSRQRPQIWVFSGQGAQWAQMGRELLANHPIFSRTIHDLDFALQSLKLRPKWTLRDELSKPKDTSQVYRAELSQPLTTAVQLGLVNVLKQLGVTADAVIGHSSGEIAAAYAADILSLSDAIIVSYLRGFVTNFQTNKGGMAAVGLSANAVKEYLLEGTVIAAENSDKATTISGDETALDQVIENIKAKHPDTLARRLRVDMAYHSPRMAIVGDSYLEMMRNTLGASRTWSQPSTSKTAMFSTVTSQRIALTIDLKYWVTNLVSPVRFSPGFSTMLTALAGQPVIIEVGPHSQLAGPIREICTAEGVQSSYIPTMIREADCVESLASAAGQLFQQGVEFDTSADSTIFPPGKVLTNLPLYQWDHSAKYWYENRVSHDWRFRKYGHHALLGEIIPESSTIEPSWRCILDLEDEPWLRDHMIATDIVFPFAGYVSMAGEAIRQISGTDIAGYKVKHVVVHTALVLNESKPAEVITTLRKRKLTDASDSKYYEFTISSHSGSTWTKHCEGNVVALTEKKSVADNVKTFPRKVMVSRWYDIVSRVGLRYGPNFQGIKFLEASPVSMHAIAGIAETTNGPFLFHPTAMDSAFQLVIAAGAKASSRNFTQLVVPTLIEEIEIYASSGLMTAEAQVSPDGKETELTCTSGQSVCLRMKGARLTALEGDQEPGFDRHKAARLEFFPNLDFVDHSTLVDAPFVRRETRVNIEETVLLSILDSAERVKDLEPSQPHYQIYREWLFREQKRASNKTYRLFTDRAHFFSTLTCEQRQDELNKRLELLSDDPVFKHLARGIHRVNQNCENLFTGKLDALNMLLEDNVLAEIYNSVSSDFSRFVKLLSINKPTLRILEVGAGTGGATELILRDLVDISNNPPHSVYTFTDISGGFFAQAAERFKYTPNMEFRLFDISQSPFEQGFEANSYDLILANNVVHATENLQATLRNLRPLLREGGQLLLSEVCATGANAPGFVFGQFSGWWMGEADDRKWEPYVHVSRWDRELKAAGFSGADTAVFDEDEPYQYCAAIISHAVSKVTTEHSPGVGGLEAIAVVCDSPDHGPSADLIADIRSRGHDVEVVKFGTAPPPANRPVLVTLDLEGYFFQDITAPRLLAWQGLWHHHQGQKLLWVMPKVQLDCDDPRPAQTLGAMRVARAELSLPFHTLEIDSSEPNFTDLVLKVFDKVVGRDDVEALSPDREFVVQNGIVKVGRAQPFSLKKEIGFVATSECDTTRLEISKPGLLETLHWVSTKTTSLAADEVEIEARAVGLNFRDIMVSMGILTFGDGTPQLGIEMSGIITSVGSAVQNVKPGDRVVALASQGCFSTKCIMKAPLVVQIPDNLGFEEAATMPAVFSTVIQALTRVAHLEKGKSVLIHSACGGIGHAAIQLCKNADVEIYVTVGSNTKAEYAENTLGISKDHIFNSRDDSFVADIMRATNGKGVDIVLNSLSGPLLHASWDCVAEFGQLVELGKRDLVEFGSLALEPFLLNRSYCCVDLAHMLERRPEKVGQLLQDSIDLFREGKIQSIASRTDFTANQITEAFRHLQKGNHIGKAVVTLPQDSSDLVSSPKRAEVSFDSSATYLLTGGLGGVGRAVAAWMAERGARNLIFLSRSAGRGGDDLSFFAELEALGCTAIPVQGQVQLLEDVERAIAAAPSPIHGILHLAMVLEDGAAVDLTFEQWTAAVAPKVDGAWNLHNSFIQRQQNLDFFLLSSSIVTSAHHPGQSNYAAANTSLEAFAQYRRRQGLPAAVLSLCPIDDIGFVAENPVIRRKLKSQGLNFLPEKEVLDYFEFAVLHQQDEVQSSSPKDQLSSWANDSHTIVGLHSEMPLDDPNCHTIWRRNREMGFYHNVSTTSNNNISKSSSGLKAFIEQATSSGDPAKFLDNDAAVDYLATEIGLRILQLMMRDADEVDISVSVHAVGMDSLMAIELRRWWKQNFAVDVTVLEIMGAGTLRGLGHVASQGLKKKIFKEG
ncbi:uncharacterized protein TRUGW13939_10406 [Talaromyces rugulosus]|uniref:Uncharacterized protein n=1 Tax=Talaromyces rugulosus TaxID=121627 RepID=A0A7H8RAV8_TALRU|nr:uncharacterized protein TRUGW13939_10406 [Talaromyces rugulosus]QKX63237.1 hypothetical protein TRUGW13939_10406 [Talaromyces rugulosus]